jgi:hypothetical protein
MPNKNVNMTLVTLRFTRHITLAFRLSMGV